MLRTRIGVLVSLLCFLALTAGARPIDVKKAQEIAENFFKNAPQTRGQSRTVQLKLLQPAQTRSTGEAAYYLFTPETERGFIIVSGDDELPQVVGYSYDSPVSESTLPPALAAWLKAFSQHVGNVRNGKATVPATRAEGGKKVVEPMVTTKWNQDKPFNDLIMNNYVTGCVATSIAQIMNYHEWPDQGVGVLEWPEGYAEPLDRVDLSTYTYDWENMLDEYRTMWDNNTDGLVPDGYTDEQAKAVATLMRDCGYAVNMDYSAEGSGAVTARLVDALTTYFKYSPGMKFHPRNLYSQEKWTEIIRTELEAGRPVNYSGTSTGDGVGHSFVCDGIDANDLLHINWGWAGAYDGFFDMNVMAPEGAGIGGGQGGYILNQGIITGIRPITPEEEGQQPIDRLTMTGLSIQLLEFEGPSYQLKIDIARISNYSTKAITVIPGIAWHATEQSGERLQKFTNKGDMEVGEYWSNPSFLHSISAIDFNGPGDYPFSFVNFTDNSATAYEPYDTGEGIYGGILTIEQDGTFSLKLLPQEAAPAVTLVSAAPEGTVYENTNFTLNVTLRNEGKTSFGEELYFALVPEDVDESSIDNYVDYLLSNYMGYNSLSTFVYGNSQITVPHVSAFVTAGRYRIHFCREITLDGGSLAYRPIPEDAPQTLEVLPMPDHPVLIMDERPLSIWEDEYMQETEVWFGATVWVHALSQTYEGRVELWALKEGADPSEEVRVFAKDGLNIGSSTEYISDFYGYTDAFFNMEEGTYTAYLKYEVEGEMQRIEGDYNRDTFRVVPSDKPQLYLTAPVVVNQGQPVPMGSMVTVEMQVSSRTAFSGKVALQSYDAAHDYAPVLYESILPVSLAAGEIKTLTFRCQIGTGQNGVVPGRYQIETRCLDEEGTWLGSILPGEYEGSLWFNVMESIDNPLTMVMYPTLDGQSSTYAGHKGIISFSVEASASIDATFSVMTYSFDDRSKPILQTEEKTVHFEAGERKMVELPYTSPEGTPNGEYFMELYVQLDEQPGLLQMASNWFHVEDRPAGQPTLAAPIVVNGGQDVQPGSNGQVSFSLTCEKRFDGWLYIQAYDAENRSVLNGPTVDVTLEAGETKPVAIPYSCPDYVVAGSYRLAIYYKTDGIEYPEVVNYGEYPESTKFSVIDVPAGIEDENTSEACHVISLHNAFLLKNLPQQADVKVVALNGTTAYHATATGTELTIPMAGAGRGVYLIVVTAPDIKPVTLKAALK